MHYVRRYAPVPWSDIAPADLQPQGDAETSVDYRHETHLGLYIKGEHVAYLGMLAVRCETKGMDLVPVSIAIADTPILVDTSKVPSQSSRSRWVDVDCWREEGA